MTVSVNRGESAGIRAGEEYDVFEMGEALVDPDTGFTSTVAKEGGRCHLEFI